MKKYLNKSELTKLGFYKIGKNNKISRSVMTFSFRGELGSNNRIDEYVILKGNIKIKNNVHIATGCTLSGHKEGIYIDDFVSLSNQTQVFVASDDYKNPFLSEGTLTKKEREKFSNTLKGKIKIGKCSIIGPFSTILPKTNIGDFTSFHPYSLIFGDFKKGFYYNLKKNKKEQKNFQKIEKLYKMFLKQNY